MIFKRFHIDGFGIWCDQTFDGLDPGLNIFFAANEGGKTTLMNFVRAMLYGFRASRRSDRYEPLRGGKHGGYLEIHDNGETFRITRTGDGSSSGDLQITDESGKEFPDCKLDELRQGTTRELYEDVFAFGLSELQGFLGNEEILTAGMATSGIEPRGFLEKLEKELETYFLKSGQARTSRKIPDLVKDIEKLQAEIKRLEERPKEYNQLLEERESLEEDSDALDDELEESRDKVTTAQMHKDAWPSYEELLDAELALEAFDLSTGEAKTAEESHAQLIEELTKKQSVLQELGKDLLNNLVPPRDPSSDKKAKLIGSVASALVGLAVVMLLPSSSWPVRAVAGMIAGIVAYVLYRQIETLKEKRDNENKPRQTELQSVKDQLQELITRKKQYERAWLTFNAKANEQEDVNDLMACLESIGTKNESERLLGAAETEFKTAGKEQSTLQKQIGGIEEKIDRLQGDDDLDTLLQERQQKRDELISTIEMWAELTTTKTLGALAMEAYEKNDQESIVRWASEYFSIMTQGAYSQVLVPRGEQGKKEIQVEATASGNRKGPDELSQATREQLYLAMRLASASLYADHCVALPLLTDDILVNFDEDRAKAAAKLLGTYAALDHQVLVFTCHRQMVDVFTTQAPDAQVHELPKPS